MTKARTLADNFAADINGITAGTGITGGGTSGTVTVTNSMATAIDAKGDLVVGTGADTFSRLAVASTAGYLLSVDSAEATGLKWVAGTSTFAGCRLTQSTSNAIANATWSAINYNTETFDTDAYHNNSTNNTRITIPSGKAGYYQFYGNATIQSTNTTTVINQLFYKNGAEVSQPYIRSGGVGYDSAMIVTVLNLSVGDYVEHYMWQNSGGERQIENGFIHFGCIYLGA